MLREILPATFVSMPTLSAAATGRMTWCRKASAGEAPRLGTL